jgi:DNA-binding HxlR family transcriptional regulator
MTKPRKSRRPVMQVLDVLGRRWALRILWELRDGPQTFRELRTACDDVSPSSLNQRLAELRTVGAVERRDEGYALTAAGVRLGAIVLDLHRWAEAMLRRGV